MSAMRYQQPVNYNGFNYSMPPPPPPMRPQVCPPQCPPTGFNFSVPPPPLNIGLPSPPIPLTVPTAPLPLPLPMSSAMPLSQLSPQQFQQPLQRRPDLGYESEEKESDANSTMPASSSRAPSPCDSARPDSESEADLAQLNEDLAGFRVSGPRPVDMALSQQMELVWHERFVDFFSRFSFGSWHLYPVFDPPDIDNTGIPRNQWRYFKDQAKVRFICMKCQKAWTSMGGQVVFWVYKDDATNQGYVHFKLYGQKCTECDSKYYEHAIWYQEEVEKVIENLYHQVGHLYYGMPAHKKRVDRRMGHPKKEHNSSTCQACRDRVCRMGQLQKRKTHQHQQQQQHQQQPDVSNKK